MKEEVTDIGIIVARFQVHELHSEHKKVIEFVKSRHNIVVIFLGVSPLLFTKTNPLDFPTRERMLKQVYPDLIVLPISDCKYDTDWSNNLDRSVKAIYPEKKATLYGSRDSFIKHYNGAIPTYEYEPQIYLSGTQIRGELRNKMFDSKEYRAGIISVTQNRFPITYTTADALIRREDKILLGQKFTDLKTEYRTIGGFFDNKRDLNIFDTAINEAKEETTLDVINPKYVTSALIPDWRYAGSQDAILSHLIEVESLEGTPQPTDDIAALGWFPIDNLPTIVQEHQFFINEWKKIRQR